MTRKARASHDRPESGAQLEDLPHDELLTYGRGLGLDLDDKLTSAELADRVREYHDLLRGLDRDALLDVIKWSRLPIHENAGTEELARHIARIQQTNYDGLSRRGLITLAQLRGLKTSDADNTEEIIDRLRRQLGFWQRWHRKRRSWVGSMLSKLVDDKTTHNADDYQFLPDDGGVSDADSARSLKRQIEDHGVVGGIASRLRGAADDYIKIKLDEIERRIDAKMDQIDQRLAEWRDREVANRLKIIRITLAATVLVAILSLGYNFLKHETLATPEQNVEQTTQERPH
jgi:hypothetical protein